MNYSLHSSLLDLSNPFLGSLLCTNLKLPFFNRFRRVGYTNNNQNVHESYATRRKLVVSSQLMPGQLEGSLIWRKQLDDPRRKQEYVRTLLIDNYDSYTYNIYQELAVVNGVPPVVVRNDEWTWEDVRHYLYEEKAFDNVVISPGPGSPACPADIGICLQLLLECWDIPILGVCLGHQALGYVHGARVVHAAEAVHGRLSVIEHNGSRLFQNIPCGINSEFKVVRYHSLILEAGSLPKELIPIAWTSYSGTHSYMENLKSGLISHAYESQTDSSLSFSHSLTDTSNGISSWPSNFSELTQRNNVLMGVMHTTRPHYGLQFHPESIATCYGRQIFKNFKDLTEDYWQKFGSTFIHERISQYPACMQVPSASQLVGIPGSGPFGIDDAKPLRLATRPGKLLGSLDQSNSHKMCTIMSSSESSTSVKNLKLKWRKLDRLAAKVGGARNIFCELFGTGTAENTFWLDSSSVEKGRARFSFMGGKGGPLWEQMTFRLSEESNVASRCRGHLSVVDARGSKRSMFLENGFFHFLNQKLASFRYNEEDFEELPFEFYGGYIGFLGYGLKVECGKSYNRHKSRPPDACFFFVDNFLVIDHCYDDVYIMTVNEGSAAITPWLDETAEKLLRLEHSALQKLDDHVSQSTTFAPGKEGFYAEKSKEQYIKDVHKCLEYIKDGESYELCLTTQLRKIVGEIDSLGLYLHLRNKNPASYAAWLNFSNENLCICCSSPERFLRLDRNNVLEAKPIKGTIARGTTQEEDKQLKLQLQYSEKDQAENLMIVDLLRNDLGSVCEPGSVHVPCLMDVESYATVHTMVSTIQGKKQSNVSAVECVRAAFPGGSMTGAPKLRSMELLDSLESCSRGIYSGSIGYFSYNQTFDLNIVIRTVIIHEGEASIGAGGAIVSLSNPEDEYNEMLLKARAPAKAVIEFQ
ncbi:hypothetical protein K2173_020408 [Erythroxylum novogranatense]|uniref:aminodeoxychorismate synthase n=1 Tax=Erythroxylum novogranatense TaxID=1862640 RepID=A0AAV8TG98_9ROSI|nr:hypothetical protein K2173_020408 [Erythroxylum novogranatense]